MSKANSNPLKFVLSVALLLIIITILFYPNRGSVKDNRGLIEFNKVKSVRVVGGLLATYNKDKYINDDKRKKEIVNMVNTGELIRASREYEIEVFYSRVRPLELEFTMTDGKQVFISPAYKIIKGNGYFRAEPKEDNFIYCINKKGRLTYYTGYSTQIAKYFLKEVADDIH